MINNLLIATAWIWGVHCLFYEGYLFEKLGNKLHDEVGDWICKPLFDCPPCMSSIHGVIFGIIFYGVSIKVIPFIICLCGINYVIKSFVYPEYED
jgi:hypothetical protein